MVLDDPVVAGQVEAIVVVGLQVFVGRFLAEPAKSLGKVSVEDDERVARGRMGIESFGQEHVGSQVHWPAPEFGESFALDALVLDVLGGGRLGDWRNDFVQPDDDRRAGMRAGLDRDILWCTIKVAGCFVPLLSFAAVHGQLDHVAVTAMKRLIQVKNGLSPVLARRNQAKTLDRITQGRWSRSRPPGRPADRSRRCRRSAAFWRRR